MEEITKVQFYYNKKTDDLFAVFPDTWDGNFYTCYSHVGQHGQVVKGYIEESVPAKVEQYKDLMNELINLVGYELLVMPAKKVYNKIDLLNYIGMGFCQPKFYKRSAWLKAKEIMDYLVSLNVGVIEFDYGHGKGKYKTVSDISNDELAEIYLKS